MDQKKKSKLEDRTLKLSSQRKNKGKRKKVKKAYMTYRIPSEEIICE